MCAPDFQPGYELERHVELRPLENIIIVVLLAHPPLLLGSHLFFPPDECPVNVEDLGSSEFRSLGFRVEDFGSSEFRSLGFRVEDFGSSGFSFTFA